MVPEPAGVGDQLTGPVDQGVVDGDDTLVAVARGGVLLELFQSSCVEGCDVPVGVREEAVEAGLVGGLGEFAVDAEDGFPLGHDQACKVFGEVPPLGFVAEEVAVLGEAVLNQRGEFNNPWHDRMLRSPTAPERFEVKMDALLPILTPGAAELQNSSFT